MSRLGTTSQHLSTLKASSSFWIQGGLCCWQEVLLDPGPSLGAWQLPLRPLLIPSPTLLLRHRPPLPPTPPLQGHVTSSIIHSPSRPLRPQSCPSSIFVSFTLYWQGPDVPRLGKRAASHAAFPSNTTHCHSLAQPNLTQSWPNHGHSKPASSPITPGVMLAESLRILLIPWAAADSAVLGDTHLSPWFLWCHFLGVVLPWPLCLRPFLFLLILDFNTLHTENNRTSHPQSHLHQPWPTEIKQMLMSCNICLRALKTKTNHKQKNFVEWATVLPFHPFPCLLHVFQVYG